MNTAELSLAIQRDILTIGVDIQGLRAQVGDFGGRLSALEDITSTLYGAANTEAQQPAEASHRPLRILAKVVTAAKMPPHPEVSIDGQDSGAEWSVIREAMRVAIRDLLSDYPPEAS